MLIKQLDTALADKKVKPLRRAIEALEAAKPNSARLTAAKKELKKRKAAKKEKGKESKKRKEPETKKAKKDKKAKKAKKSG